MYPISAGDVILTAPNELHRCIYHSDGVHEHFCIWMRELPFAAEVLPEHFNGQTGRAEQIFLHLRGIPVDDLASEPIVLEIEW